MVAKSDCVPMKLLSSSPRQIDCLDESLESNINNTTNNNNLYRKRKYCRQRDRQHQSSSAPANFIAFEKETEAANSSPRNSEENNEFSDVSVSAFRL